MFRYYSVSRAREIIAENRECIDRACAPCGLPPACLKAVLLKEIPELSFGDTAADLIVSLNWIRYSLFHIFTPERHTRNPLRNFDSSTGYAQIFGRVAIEAVNFARERGISCPPGIPEELSPSDPDDLKMVWGRLHRDTQFNLSCAALNLVHAAFQMTGRTDFGSFGPEELKLVFSRYNGNVRRITRYGEEAYAYYLAYS